MGMTFLFILLGFFGLFLGGEFLIRGSIALSKRYGLSEFTIGVLVIGLGTSMPELLVSVDAALGGVSDIALGNVVGSNIANILLVIGLAAVILPFVKYPRRVISEAFRLCIISLLLYCLVWGTIISRIEGVVLLIAMVFYILVLFSQKSEEILPSYSEQKVTTFEDVRQISLWGSLFFILCGIGLLFGSADLLVKGATTIAIIFNISDSVIGLSLVAFGTSLPEIGTTVVAAIKRKSDVILGSAIGSCIFNVLFILGLTAVIHPVNVAARLAVIDAPIMLGTHLLLFGLLFMRWRIGRLWGGLMLTGYAIYIGVMFSGEAGM